MLPEKNRGLRAARIRNFLHPRHPRNPRLKIRFVWDDKPEILNSLAD